MPKESTAEKVMDYIRGNNLLPDNNKIIVAVSGGTDSVCLLHILAASLPVQGVYLHVAHLNHKLRGAESDADANYVRRLAKRFKLPATIESRNVSEYRNQKRIPLEEAAREVRYRFLAEVLQREKAGCIFTGHTGDDNVETILMNIIRGSGLTGLRGMQPKSNLLYNREYGIIPVARPLLGITRAETEAYCRHYVLKPRDDSSNHLPVFRRNNVRLKLIPLLQGFNPDFNSTLLRLAAIAGEQVALLDSQTAGLWNGMVKETANSVIIDRSKLKKMHPSLQKHLIRKAIEKLAGSLKDIEVSHIEAVAALLTKPSGKSAHLPFNIHACNEYNSLFIGTGMNPEAPYPTLGGEFKIKIPGITIKSGWRITASLAEKAPENSANPFSAILDADKAGGDLTVRKRNSGDSFVPLGMGQAKKVQDFMVDEKIPRQWRSRVPLVCNKDRIAWIAGWRIDDRYKTTASTRRFLTISFERES